MPFPYSYRWIPQMLLCLLPFLAVIPRGAYGQTELEDDPLSRYNGLPCNVCIRAGGVFCETGGGESSTIVCNSPAIAEAFPTTCIDLGGTPYTTICETETCSLANDFCPFQMNRRCEANDVICTFGDSDCFDCDPCMQFRFDGCRGCTDAGCLWCGSDALCLTPEILSDDALFLPRPRFTCSAEDFVDECPSSSSITDPMFPNPLLDSMEWVFDMIKVKPVWEQGIFGTGVGIRINDEGVDDFQTNFASFDRESSCSLYLPPRNEVDFSHGTTCAALAAGGVNNECSVGIAPGATVSACRIFDEEGGFVRETTTGFRYLYENQTLVDISSNSYGLRNCLPISSSSIRHRALQQLTECPFVQQGAFTPCNRGSPCRGEDWTAGALDLSASCQSLIVSYCRNSLNYERDEEACIFFLDLYVRCDYNIDSEQQRNAIIRGIMEGRQGKGIIYVFSSGNDHELGDDTNFEESLNSRFTISVGAVGRDAKHSSYSTTGAALSVTAPGGDADHYSNLITTSSGGGCRDTFVGTSWAAPLVSGVLALVLESNPELTWRDVQGILASTSQIVDGDDPSWTINSAGIHHSYRYGFGIVDADAAVAEAKTWKLYEPEAELFLESGPINIPIPENLDGEVLQPITVETTGRFKAESVVVTMDLSHSSRGDLDVILVSPSGTKSILHPGQRPENTQVDEEWKLMTLRHWDEDPTGEWTLRLVDRKPGNLDVCKSNPDYFFVEVFPDGPFIFECSSFSQFSLCTLGGRPGPGLISIDYDLSLGLSDPIFSNGIGVGPLEACCECGGGSDVTLTPNVLRSWELVVYGREIAETVSPSLEPSLTPTNDPSGRPSASPTLAPTSSSPSSSPSTRPSDFPPSSPAPPQPTASDKSPTPGPTPAPVDPPAQSPTPEGPLSGVNTAMSLGSGAFALLFLVVMV